MEHILGQLVLKCKDVLSYDAEPARGDNTPMSRTEYKRAFIARTKAARESAKLTQQQIADALRIPQDRYKQYETRSLLPHDLIPGFCLVTKIDPADLFTGSTRRRSAA